MTETIIIQCQDCEHSNRQSVGMPGYELVTIEFESFSEAFEHKLANPNHYMTIFIRKESDEND